MHFQHPLGNEIDLREPIYLEYIFDEVIPSWGSTLRNASKSRSHVGTHGEFHGQRIFVLARCCGGVATGHAPCGHCRRSVSASRWHLLELCDVPHACRETSRRALTSSFSMLAVIFTA
eukprot:TRINITY_DN15193_c1_g2_i1.p2 TRINITY_DN15193_c1_g2~~TRINITY_DN15193_c1_g2_i1.p2  ORF type:complete len:118 (+),score=10.93 TRINITY_DN15193_c1_g2_i1:508-861(+)